MMPALVPSPARKPLDWLLGVPNDIASALGMLPAIAENTKTMSEHTTQLAGITEILQRITDDTGPMEKRIETIAAAMPTLVEVQNNLADLPDTMARLDERLDYMTALLDRMVVAVESLAVSVDELQESLGPVGRLARRVPGGRRRERAAAAETAAAAEAEPAEAE